MTSATQTAVRINEPQSSHGVGSFNNSSDPWCCKEFVPKAVFVVGKALMLWGQKFEGSDCHQMGENTLCIYTPVFRYQQTGSMKERRNAGFPLLLNL